MPENFFKLWNLITSFNMLMLINFETFRGRHIPKCQWIIQFPHVLPLSMSRFLVSCCQTLEGCVRIKHSNSGFNTGWEAYLAWQTLEIIILTCQRWYMPASLHYLEMKEVKENKENYKTIWSNTNCGKGDIIQKRNKKFTGSHSIHHLWLTVKF